MNRLRISLICLFMICLMLTACGLYDKEYYTESVYQLEARKDTIDAQTVSVSDISELETAIINIIEGSSESEKIIFSTAYSGDPSDDLSATCKKLITRNPLCAYCVETIDYDLYKVLAYYEADIKVSFADSAVSISDIVRMNYTVGLSDSIDKAMRSGNGRIAILVNHSPYDSDDIVEIAQNIYFKSPLCVPCEPKFSVNVFSGNASQKLYEITIDYVVSDKEFEEFKKFIAEFNPFDGVSQDESSDVDKCALAASYILNSCAVSNETTRSSAYYALSRGSSDSKGLSLAFVALCKMNNLECTLVNGQRDWKSHYWNIIKIDNSYYHVDIERCITEGVKYGFLLNDEKMWQSYRWNLSLYPECSGALTYASVSFPEISGENSENTE